MKKLILTVALLLTVSFAFATNEVEKVSVFGVEEALSVEFTKVDFTMESFTQINTVVNEKIVLGTAGKTCAEKADAAEAEYCGFVGCNTSYWLGYMDSCMDQQE
jgi:hypothetical protein